jgi:tRNA modification GTPase
MMFLQDQQTIVAPATPPGEGGIGIVRLSGPGSAELLSRYFQPTRPLTKFASHRLYHGRLVRQDGSLVDEVMAVLMLSPHSYTREDVVEIHSHGGGIVQRRILQVFIEGGARLARPGEFTLRAFLNGRVDLASAEAVIDVIRSRSEAACSVALGQLEGRLSRHVYGYRERLADLLAEVEAGIDFPEEDLEISEQRKLQKRSRELVRQMEGLLATFESGRVLKEGLAILIFGKPNVGKSSLMNSLLGEARTIVTDIPGTTRDVVEERMVLNGIPLRLVDTAGVRETSDPIESEGVRRAREKVAGSDLVLLVVDGSQPLDDDDRLALEFCRDVHLLLVVNKSDLGTQGLPDAFAHLPAVQVSAQVGAGLEELKAKICSLFLQGSGADCRETVVLSDSRHWEAIFRAKQALERFLAGIDQDLGPEFGALELREALEALGEITGETTPGDILEKIFSRFCIGK